ncbi:GspH/FimT family pseudopilin [Microbulbifer thermotolerans]|uniref:GspH/FimT family pseudopilin n=1 Tax=Microbulbifer thermotolerans TaxID=252514 RepID=UPI00224944EB|nr:GspH/FimT family pseudopilin [Microbulbifer thermotolerans]MCX2832519.1 GspH/FimT family pseudopilin [Microbulbifer thermotolerans]
MSNFRRLAGFTIVELMVVLMILGIITAMAVPSFNTMIKNNRVVTMTNDLNGLLQYARAEAVRRGGGVRVSAIDGDVANGLRVWFDSNSDNGFDSGEELRELNIDLATLALDANIGGANAKNVDFTFNARGGGSLGNTLTLKLCDDRTGNHGRELELLVSGAIRLNTGIACSSGD